MEVSVCFGSCTLPLDGGECLYIKQKINSALDSEQVLSILPSVDGEFFPGCEPTGRSRALKFCFASRQAMVRVRHWLSKNKIVRGDTIIVLTLERSIAHVKSLSNLRHISVESDRLQPQHHRRSEPQSDPTLPTKAACYERIPRRCPNTAPRMQTFPGAKQTRTAARDCKVDSAASIAAGDTTPQHYVPASQQGPAQPPADAARSYWRACQVPAPDPDGPDADWAAELVRVRQRLDSVAAVHRLRL
jgi:hypothetical protein